MAAALNKNAASAVKARLGKIINITTIGTATTRKSVKVLG